ncbi:MAG: M48 family metallopeptidase [Myxococcales bacterium]|nr:M48 family metallopeptidase [Myxococcales bacterium]
MLAFAANYYDGQTSDSHAVRVRVELDGTLHIEGLAEPLRLPAADVQVGPRLGNTPRALSLPSGAKLETEDNDTIDALQASLRRGSGAALVHWLESRWHTAVLAAVVIGSLTAAGMKWGIPAAARTVAHGIPQELAFDIGQGTLATLDRLMFEPTQLEQAQRGRLGRSFDEMARSYPGTPTRLVFRHAGFPNAFALPDGTVVMTDELVELSDKDEQVLSVLAHELGHLHHRHSLRMALESSAVALLLGAYFGDATQFAAAFATLPTIYAEAQYSQTHETEADTFALTHMRRHGMALHHFADIMTKLEAECGGSRDTEGPLIYLSSHPSTKDRIARFK